MRKLKNAYWACYRFIRDYMFEPFWYRFFGHKHHIVRTGLTPASWYDTDTRMLYAVMSLVEWFVENDMMTWSKEDRIAEMARIAAESSDSGEAKCLSDQWAAEDGIMEIYKWWKNYPNRQNEIREALHEWSEYMKRFQKDEDDLVGFLNVTKNMNEEQKSKEYELSNALHKLENKLEHEEQLMLDRAVELRGLCRVKIRRTQ
jgi:hypothetical protein